VTSLERKAHETATVIAGGFGVPIAVDEDLREHERASAGFLPAAQFVQSVEELLRSSRELVFGDEAADAVFHRFKGAVDRARRASPDRDQVVVSHGTAISIYVGRILGVDPVALWRELRTPTALIMQDGKMETSIPFGASAR
jgi:broad specificity phosphatase PhoE